MKRTLLILLFVSFACRQWTNAQDILIQYDNADSTTRYFDVDASGNKSAVKKLPFAKKNKRIIVELLNVNPFAYTISHQISQREVKSQFDSTKNLIPYLTANLNTFRTEFQNLLGVSSVQSTTTRGARTDKANEYVAALQSSLSEILFIDDKFSKWLSTYSILKRQLLSTSQTKAEIISQMESTIRDDFEIDPASDINIKDSIRRNLRELMFQYRTFKTNYITAKPYLDTSADRLRANSAQVANEQIDSLIKVYSTGRLMAKLYSIDDLLFMANNASFTYAFEEVADQDITDITVNIIRSPAKLDADSIPNIQVGHTTTKKYRVINRGETVVRSSIGLAFPTLFDNAVRYGIEDSKVQEFEDDNYVPNLTTFINFYPFKGEFSNLGGVLGFGYPLTGENKNINIMLGLSGTFGDKNSVVLSGGFNFGQTNRLASGWKVGKEVTGENIQIPTEKEWKVGAFLGLAVGFFNR